MRRIAAAAIGVVCALAASAPFPAVGAPAPKPPPVVRFWGEYRALCRQNPAMELVPVAEHVPGIITDSRYATAQNFTGQKLYAAPDLYVSRAAAEKLAAAQKALSARGIGLILFDAYRPYSVTESMWRLGRERFAAYIAPPWLGSDHNRGIAVDVALADLATGKPLPAPTGYDDFTNAAWHGAPCRDPAAAASRKLLLDTMREHGFVEFKREWWHYHLREGKDFPLLDIPHKKLRPR